MGAEKGFRETSGFEQCETQKDRVAHAAPNGPGDIAACGNTLYQDRINTHAHHDKERLESQGEQGFQVVLPGGAPVTVGHGGKGDRPYGGGQVHFDHAAVNDQHDTGGKGVHSKPHKKGLEPQAEKFTC